jgi:hypothetical protein
MLKTLLTPFRRGHYTYKNLTGPKLLRRLRGHRLEKTVLFKRRFLMSVLDDLMDFARREGSSASELVCLCS